MSDILPLQPIVRLTRQDYYVLQCDKLQIVLRVFRHLVIIPVRGNFYVNMIHFHLEYKELNLS